MIKNFVISIVSIAAMMGTFTLAQDKKANTITTLKVEVAVNGFTFKTNGPVDDTGFPKAGAPFIIEGYIYPEGTLLGGDGINPDGSPQYPDLVIGKWISKGFFLVDLFGAQEGPVMSSTHVFMFESDQFGSQMLVTEGYTLEGDNIPNHRAVVGATGALKENAKYVVETRMGFNATLLPNFTEEFIGLDQRILFKK